MSSSIDEIRTNLAEQLKSARDVHDVQNLQVAFLGKKGLITSLLRQIASVPEAQRREFGEGVNSLKEWAAGQVQARLAELAEGAARHDLDFSLPGRRLPLGKKHILAQVEEEVESVFLSMGFDIEEGPEIEEEYYNFEALNIPADHPARDMQDTFYLAPGILLRTHTSPIQVRTMKREQPPIRMVATGRCYRRDAVDASHSPVFTQIEGLVVDKGISFADLKGVLQEFVTGVFGSSASVRLLPSYFPFVEPGAETAISCPICGGHGCPTCKNSGWIEMGGSGMVHQNVLREVGYDTDVYQGFAFGWGIERIAMIKYGIRDIRLFYENDLDFLGQF
ncbi:MAG TPA: phenylalanine--tRNA ligase subunit alpha [Candidatus Cryosericum sp.]|jgi:phenylalanyl-tRNA synthetase alpha chain|nr:phenylalanine--tRNA ligase subunit alpha [Candidatus Cryosericum sp.]